MQKETVGVIYDSYYKSRRNDTLLSETEPALEERMNQREIVVD